jgi:cytochrome oxidase assembly protein ShyY1
MYRFLRRPWWIVSHVAVLALIVAMIWAGFWQLRRLDDKKDRNRLIEQNVAAAPVSVDRILDELQTHSIAQLQYRRVQVTGRYDTDAEVAIRNRTYNGAPGRWVVTPLIPSDGTEPVLVLRGFVPQSIADTDPPFDGVEPPEGEVTVVGAVETTQTRGSFGPTDPATGTLHEMARVDIARIAQQFGRELAPFYLELSKQEPATASDVLSPVPLPELDEGPHLGYAAQWGIFTLIALIGYPLVLRKVAHQQLPPDDQTSGEPPDPPGGDPELTEPVGSPAGSDRVP